MEGLDLRGPQRPLFFGQPAAPFLPAGGVLRRQRLLAEGPESCFIGPSADFWNTSRRGPLSFPSSPVGDYLEPAGGLPSRPAPVRSEVGAGALIP
jgi:hypothetical protein